MSDHEAPDASRHQPTEREERNPIRTGNLHLRLGAERAPWRSGAFLPATYGDTAAEYRTLRRGCGLVDQSDAEAIEVTGEDRLRFMNGQVTCDLAKLEPGQGTFGFLLNKQGKVEGDTIVLALEDRLWLEVPPEQGFELKSQVGFYIVADRAEIDTFEPLHLAVLGPEAPSVLARVLDGGAENLPAERYRHRAVRIDDVPVRLVRDADLGGPAFLLWIEEPKAFEAVYEALQEAGAEPVGWRAFEQLRIEEGRPIWGMDFGLDCFPQETGREEEGVSYTKGCYRGQEVVARIHYRGGVRRQLRGVIFEDDELGHGAQGSTLVLDDRELGIVGSAAWSPALEATLGLAVVHERAAPGTRVEAFTDEPLGHARVVELPFDLPTKP